MDVTGFARTYRYRPAATNSTEVCSSLTRDSAKVCSSLTKDSRKVYSSLTSDSSQVYRSLPRDSRKVCATLSRDPHDLCSWLAMVSMTRALFYNLLCVWLSPWPRSIMFPVIAKQSPLCECVWIWCGLCNNGLALHPELPKE